MHPYMGHGLELVVMLPPLICLCRPRARNLSTRMRHGVREFTVAGSAHSSRRTGSVKVKVEPDELPWQGQPEPGAFLSAAPHLPELREHCFLIRGRDANAGVRVGHLCHMLVQNGAHVDLSPFGRELQGIGQEVEKHLLHFAPAAADSPDLLVDGAPQQHYDAGLGRPPRLTACRRGTTGGTPARFRQLLGPLAVPAIAIPQEVNRTPKLVLHRCLANRAEWTIRLGVRVVERKVFGYFFTLHLSYRKEWGAAVTHGTVNARDQGDGSDGPTIGTGELIDFLFVAVVPGCRRAHGYSS